MVNQQSLSRKFDNSFSKRQLSRRWAWSCQVRRAEVKIIWHSSSVHSQDNLTPLLRPLESHLRSLSHTLCSSRLSCRDSCEVLGSWVVAPTLWWMTVWCLGKYSVWQIFGFERNLGFSFCEICLACRVFIVVSILSHSLSLFLALLSIVVSLCCLIRFLSPSLFFRL